MKKQFVFLFAALMVAVSMNILAQGAQDFTIINKTGVVIDQLFVSPVDVEEWGEDILGTDVMELDAEWEIKFNPQEEQCKWDLKITDGEGNAIMWEDVDLCATAVIVLHWDGEKAWITLE
jgi:hypothetical protein